MLRAQIAQKPAPSRPSAGSSNPAAEDLAAPRRRSTRADRQAARHAQPRTTAATAAVEHDVRATRRPRPSRRADAEAGGVPNVGGLQGGRCHGSRRRRGRRRRRRRRRPPSRRGHARSRRLPRTRRPRPTPLRRPRRRSGAHPEDGGDRPGLIGQRIADGRGADPGPGRRARRGRRDGPRPAAARRPARPGPSGVGKTTLALDLAAGLPVHAEPADRPCRACRGCRLVGTATHPDLHRLGPDGPGRQVVIGGPEAQLRGVRDLVAELVLLPVEGGHRVAIVEHADRMNEDAQKALLKTLEEPPAGVTIVLCADEEDAPPADGPLALLPPASRAGRVAGHRGDPRRPRAGRPADRGPARPARRRSARAWRWPTPAPRRRSSSATSSPASCST